MRFHKETGIRRWHITHGTESSGPSHGSNWTFPQRKILKWLAVLLVVMMAAEWIQFTAQAEEIAQAPARNQMVRVHLSRLNIKDRMDLTLECDYQLTTQAGVRMLMRSGSELAFLLREGSVYLHYEGMTLNAGTSAKLERVDSQTQEPTGFYLTHFPALYRGDLYLDVDEDVLRPILHIHVEDYLLGVVPYEMGDSFPLEALKAQAVAARTYAMRRQNANAAYDVVDTTNDQVFKGYQPGSPVSDQAVRETRGVCGFFKNQLAQCYYSASNGGQMELVESVWPVEEDFSYYTFGADPYDVDNPLSVVRSFALAKQYDGEAPAKLHEYAAKKIKEQIIRLGYDAAPESIRIEGVNAAMVDMPNTPDSKLMTMLRLKLSVSARKRNDVTVRVVDADPEEVSLFATQEPNLTFAPVVTPEPVYGDFEQLDEAIELSIPIFPDAEDLFSMDISTNYENEIWSVNETEDAFVLEARRYGHGVGMSQRGAQWMAGTEGKTYRDILSFYYPGMKLMQYPEQPAALVQPEEALLSTAGPAPSPTPRPTLMPMTQKAAKGQWVAEVTGIAEDSSLNLRSEPNLNCRILMRLYKGQKLLVLERCAEEGWVKVRTDVTEGYVMESYLTRVP